MNKYFKFVVFVLLSINVLLILGEFASWAHRAFNEPNGFAITEFLINYQGGFVRRGLIGEGLYQFCSFTGTDPKYIILPGCIAAFVIYTTIIIVLFRKNSLSLWILPTYYALCGGDCIRKDYMVMLLVLLILYLLKKNSKNASSMRLLGITCISVFMLNVHEASFFIILPLAFTYILFAKNEITISERLIHIIISTCTFLIISIYKGDPETATKICESWGSIAPYENINLAGIDNSITALTWTFQYAADFHKHINFASGPGWKYAGTILRPIVLLSILYLVIHVTLVGKREYADFPKQVSRLVNLALFQLVSLSPMFTILSCDFRRCCFYWTMSTLSSFILLKDIELTLPGKHLLNRITTPISRIFALKAPLWIVYALLLCISVPYWYNKNYLTPLVRQIYHIVTR